MLLPDELMVDSFLPAMRELVARKLRSNGLSQSKIAAALGVTQASVSMYLSSKPSRALQALSAFGVNEESADRYAAILAEDLRRDPLYSVATLTTIWNNLLGSGQVCGPHVERYPGLAGCDVCVRVYGAREGEGGAAVAEVADAVAVLEKSRSFGRIMPEVSVNIACLPRDSDSLEDVVAVPGRIVRVKGLPKAMLGPEPGASRHMARVLLIARRKNKSARACINVKYDTAVSRAIKKLGLRTAEVGGYSSDRSEDPTVEAFEAGVSRFPSGVQVLIDRGGPGIEPNAYLLAESARDAVGLAVRVSELASSH